MARNAKSNKNSSTSNDSNANNANFNENDRKRLYEINNTVKLLVEEVKSLKNEIERTNRKAKRLEIENERLKKSVNLSLFKIDALEQYGRRENLRIHGIPESKNNQDDGEEIVLKIAKSLNVDLQPCEIQRAHRLGKKTTNNISKPRPIIVRFISHKKRNKILFAKSNLKKTQEFSQVFITEDLTPLRSKLLQYIKKECQNDFVLGHTFNGNIRMKRSAKNQGLIGEGEKDQGTGVWLTVSSPDDLFNYDVDINFKTLNYKPLLFNCDSLNEDCSTNNAE